MDCIGVQPARGESPLSEYLKVNVELFERNLHFYQTVFGCKHIKLASQKESLKGEIGKLVITDHAVMDIMEFYHLNYGLQTIVLRLPPVYGIGPYIANSGLGRMMECARKGEPIELWGDTTIRRDFISIHDVVTAIECVASSEQAQGVYSISGGLISLREEGETVRRVFGSESNLLMVPEKANNLEPSCVYLNQKRIKDLGWNPKWTFEDIVRELKEGM